jgi:hypothetical protein
MANSLKQLLPTTAVAIVLLSLATHIFTGQTLADEIAVATDAEAPGILTETTRSVATGKAESETTTVSGDNRITHLQQTMPHLEQALIIFVSANGLLIISGLLFIYMKERLHRQSAQTLATFRTSQSIVRGATTTSRDKDTR